MIASPELTPDTHLEVAGSAILVPMLALLVMSAMEGLGEREQNIRWRDRVAKLGWDVCVLAIGVAGGIFANGSVLTPFRDKPKLVSLVEAATMLLCLACGVGTIYIRRKEPVSGRLALLAAVLGGAALAVPIYLATTF